jgi:DNA transformation protein
MKRRGEDDAFLDFVVDQLADWRAVDMRRMFGGTGLYADEVFFGVVYRGRLYFKVDEDSVGRFEAEGMGPFRPNQRQVLRTYYQVPAAVLEDRDRLAEWARRAVAAQQDSQA